MKKNELKFAVLVIALLTGADEPSTVAQVARDRAALQGNWRLISARPNGEDMDPSLLSHFLITYEGDRKTVSNRIETLARDILIEIDPSRNPRSITETIASGPNLGKSGLGIYRIEGDVLTTCMRIGEGPRPTEFRSEPGGQVTLQVFRRINSEPVAAEQKRFAGTWLFASIEYEGISIPEARFKDHQLILEQDRFTSKTEGPTVKGFFKVDPTASPRTIDVTLVNDSGKEVTHSGIYELEGDIYKVCMPLTGTKRPTQFNARAGSGQMIQVLKREKP